MNLNFTAGREAMASAVEQCGIRTILTSKAFLAKAKIEPHGRDGLSGGHSWARSSAMRQSCARWLRHAAARAPAGIVYAGRSKRPDSLATVIFSSGSTGVPKGVMLSHYNVISNIEAMAQVFWIGERDRIVGVLPFFHSFGFTVTIWFPLISGCGVGLSPESDGREERSANWSRNTKARSCFRRRRSARATRASARAEEFASLRFVLVGAEKLREPIGAGVPGEVRPGAAGRLRVHGNVAGGGGERAGFRSRQGYADRAAKPGRSAIRCPAWR